MYGTEIGVEALVWIYLSQRCCGCGDGISGSIMGGKFLNR